MKIVLLFFLFIFAIEDIWVRSIPLDLLILYVTIVLVKALVMDEYFDISTLLGIVPAIGCLMLSIITREGIGLGDTAIIAIIGITLGGIDTIWIWWVSSVMALVFCFGRKMTILRKKDERVAIGENSKKDQTSLPEGGIDGRSSSNNTIDINHNISVNRRRNPIV